MIVCAAYQANKEDGCTSSGCCSTCSRGRLACLKAAAETGAQGPRGLGKPAHQ
eukprot:m.68980 g.68980  ORF g.68980 m.68980 type:complete len:53 (-) comp14102_c0_seq1:1733-1891(-)